MFRSMARQGVLFCPDRGQGPDGPGRRAGVAPLAPGRIRGADTGFPPEVLLPCLVRLMRTRV